MTMTSQHGGAGWGSAAVAAVVLFGGLGIQASAESRLQVDYQPPWLTVKSEQVEAAEVLRAIGKRVGFSIIEVGGSSAPVTISVSGPVQTVLRTLLLDTSYALVYRASGGPRLTAADIEKVVILGPGMGTGGEREVAGHAEDAKLVKKKLDQSPTVISETPARLYSEPGSAPDSSTVSKLLGEQLISMVPRAATSDGPEGPLAQDPPPMEPQAMATVVLRAQQGIQALVDALTVAGATLAQSVAKTAN